jgi:hypothetical protein
MHTARRDDTGPDLEKSRGCGGGGCGVDQCGSEDCQQGVLVHSVRTGPAGEKATYRTGQYRALSAADSTRAL